MRFRNPPLRLLHGRAADAALAAGLLVFVLASTFAIPSDARYGSSSSPAVGVLLTVVTCAALVWRRDRPVAVGLFTGLTCTVYYPLSEPDGPLAVAYVIALYSVAAAGRLAVAALLGLIAVAGTYYGEEHTGVNHLEDAGLYLLAGWLVAVVAVGAVMHNRRAYLREAERRLAEAERGRAEAARRQVTEERLRIARDLHDVLGHHISLINVQAAAALHGLHRDPSAAESALTAIKGASKETLRELRATLGVLRQVDEEDPAPAAGLARLGDLASGAIAAGLAVRVEQDGAAPPSGLSADADLAAYRVVQESLTNITRHSDAATALVRVRRAGDTVIVEVEDDGAPLGEATAGSGTGLRGMRERVTALGGELTAGPRPEGGFAVRAVFIGALAQRDSPGGSPR
ncbi:sensor histidine kinase [Actinomadura hibisca]|uniref:sensor histidine kinase n=1 Tax=Actinomadura hibisca TaxID=68565 RepID=UPI00082C4377|nr:sensor histidine kinase [Actinomadura hibisca]